jgi:hypothetical protein
MEGFSMPWSNKRTAGLPSPHSIGLQSHCSAPLGSLPLGLCQATASCQIHAPPGAPPLEPCQIHTTPWPPPLNPQPLRICWAPAPHGMTGSMPHLDSCLLGCIGYMPCWDPYLLGHDGSTPYWDPPPLDSSTPQALLGCSSVCYDQRHAPPGPQTLRDGHQLGVRQPHPPAHWDPHP